MICRLLTRAGLAAALLAPAALAVDLPEVEGNNTKGAANLFTLASGDTISGSTNNASTDPDYFRVRADRPAGGIYLHTFASNTALAVNSIRGVNATFVAGDIDFTNAGSGRQSIKWYSLGATTDMYVRTARLSGSGAQTYVNTLTTTQVTPTNAGSVNAGSVSLAPALLGDSEIYLYDADFNIIAANDNRSFTDSRALLTPSLANGVYYVAIGSGNSGSAQKFSTDPASPFFDGAGSGAPTVLLDPGSVATPVQNPLAALARPENLGRSASDFALIINGGAPINATNGTGQGLEMAFFTFEVVPAPGSLALLGLGGLFAARRRRD